MLVQLVEQACRVGVGVCGLLGVLVGGLRVEDCVAGKTTLDDVF